MNNGSTVGTCLWVWDVTFRVDRRLEEAEVMGLGKGGGVCACVCVSGLVASSVSILVTS